MRSLYGVVVPIAVLFCAAVLVGCGGAERAATGSAMLDTSGGPVPGRLVYASQKDGNLELYTRSLSGGVPTRVTNHAADDYNPQWSPDGTKIAFVSTRAGNPELYVMWADGTHVKRLTSNSVPDNEPSWSPNGARLVLSRGHGDATDIYSIKASGGGLVRHTSTQAQNSSPCYSANGQRIIFARRFGDNQDICRINTDGSNLVRLTTHVAADGHPDCSWVTGKIVFHSNRKGTGTADDSIFEMDADGSGERAMTTEDTDRMPSWSSDGQRIVFQSSRAGNWDVFIMQANGLGVQQVSTAPGPQVQADWYIGP